MWPTAASIDNTNATYAEAPAFDVGNWHHLVGVVDVPNRKISLYVDGVLAVSTAMNAAWQPWQANGSLVVGRSFVNGSTANHLAGTVDDVKVWQGVLNAREIWDLKQGQSF
jgi:hypothetical protein